MSISEVKTCCVLSIFKTCVLVGTHDDSFLAKIPSFKIREGQVLKTSIRRDSSGKFVEAVLFIDRENTVCQPDDTEDSDTG